MFTNQEFQRRKFQCISQTYYVFKETLEEKKKKSPDILLPKYLILWIYLIPVFLYIYIYTVPDTHTLRIYIYFFIELNFSCYFIHINKNFNNRSLKRFAKIYLTIYCTRIFRLFQILLYIMLPCIFSLHIQNYFVRIDSKSKSARYKFMNFIKAIIN